MKYTIKHGSIAACQIVTLPNGEEIAISDSPEEPNLRILPLEVIAALNRQFGIVLSLPYGMRQEFIDNSIPFDIEVSE